jgi:hypothetical protein
VRERERQHVRDKSSGIEKKTGRTKRVEQRVDSREKDSGRERKKWEREIQCVKDQRQWEKEKQCVREEDSV